MFKTVTVTALKALNENLAVVTSSDMLISQIYFATFYNNLMRYEDEDNMFPGTKASIEQAETYCIPQIS